MKLASFSKLNTNITASTHDVNCNKLKNTYYSHFISYTPMLSKTRRNYTIEINYPATICEPSRHFYNRLQPYTALWSFDGADKIYHRLSLGFSRNLRSRRCEFSSKNTTLLRAKLNIKPGATVRSTGRRRTKPDAPQTNRLIGADSTLFPTVVSLKT